MPSSTFLLVSVGTVLFALSHLSNFVVGQREWVQWGPLRVYVVGRGGRNGNLQQLRDDREVNSVQDILAQLDTGKIDNSSLPLPLISITLPRTNESFTLDCITSNNEPGQCKPVRDCFINAFTKEGKIKNRALLEADVESSVSCYQRLPFYESLGGYSDSAAILANNNNKTDIRDKLICCEKPKGLDFMKIVNISDIKTQGFMENLTLSMLDMGSANNNSSNLTISEKEMLDMIEELPNFEALIAPLMPDYIMKLQKSAAAKTKSNQSEDGESTTTASGLNLTDAMMMDDMMDTDDDDDGMMLMPDMMKTTSPSPMAAALIMAVQPKKSLSSKKRGDSDDDPKDKKASSSAASSVDQDYEIHGNFSKTNSSASNAIMKKDGPSKLCIIKPHLECAARRTGDYKRPENVALKNKYAWMATLFVDRQMFCMGSLIDAEHILTAAHCFPTNPDSMDFEKVKVGIGYNSERPNITSPFVNRKVSRIIIHEGFNFKTLLNDIAIVKLETPAFNKTALFDYDDVLDQEAEPQPKPICFSEANEDVSTTFENQEAILSGWTIPRRRRKTMAQEISIRVWNNEECCAKYGDIPPGGITDEMVCAFTYGKNDCFSRYNTGAPLFVITEKGKRVNAHNHTTPNYIVDRYDGDDEGDYVQFQIGILSWGYGCKDFPPVFTRVNPYFEWIEQTLAESSPSS